MKKIFITVIILMGIITSNTMANTLLDHMFFEHSFIFTTRNYANLEDGNPATNAGNDALMFDYEFVFGVMATPFQGEVLSIDVLFSNYLGNYFEHLDDPAPDNLFNQIGMSHKWNPYLTTSFNFGDELYTLGLHLEYLMSWGFDSGVDCTVTRFGLLNTIRIPNAVDIGVDTYANIRSNSGNSAVWDNHVRLFLNPRLSITSPNFAYWEKDGTKGAYPFGLTFAIWEDVHLGFDLANAADTKPGEPDATARHGVQQGAFEQMRFETYIWLKQDILGALNYAGIIDNNDIRFSVFAEEQLIVGLPYMWGNAEAYNMNVAADTPIDYWPYGITFPFLVTSGKYGVQLYAYGFRTDLALTVKTQDCLNSEIDEDGSNGATTDYWGFGGRQHGRAQVGVQVLLEYASDFGFTVGMQYDGFANVRDYDADEDGYAGAYSGGTSTGLHTMYLNRDWVPTGHPWNNYFQFYFKIAY